MTATIPSQPANPRQSNRDSMAIQDALATLVEAGFTISGVAEFEQDGIRVRITLSQAHHPMVVLSRVVDGVHHHLRYESHRLVDGVQRPFDTQSAVEYAIGLLGASTTWAVTR